MNTKLILVEGLPGSGKSTTAKLVHEILSGMNKETELFFEGNLEHPADYDGVACFDKNGWENLLSMSGDAKSALLVNVQEKDGHYLLPYQKMRNSLSDELIQLIFKHDIYELPLEQNIELIADRWADFANSAASGQKIFIFECCFIQNPVTMGMVKYNAPKETTIGYVQKLADSITRLNPLLIYVAQDNLELSFRKAVKERPVEWSNGFISYYTEQGYGKAHNLMGLEGTLQVLEARQSLEKEIFDSLEMRKVIVNNSSFEEDSYKETIKKILSQNV
ncbi:hypothetical protein A8F94_07290 [Bacillus sp. FJAT-27225]|uniref:hypothetical protein n=1 Tax=Bacillus sp. FJAT-27225 TaxID=1743144 RepID=UPI00080C2D92|nr:hypothetical protein [Bacillus sp. FJAT-27225]OCA87652.1 hypothetical protein A8F94_07290 [Bacillus sp. FJAT-27225]